LQIFDADIWALIQRRQPVKLDPTIERAVFRQQAACLKQELGYRFDSPQQMWFPQ
jgi:hypothetical protein